MLKDLMETNKRLNSANRRKDYNSHLLKAEQRINDLRGAAFKIDDKKSFKTVEAHHRRSTSSLTQDKTNDTSKIAERNRNMKDSQDGRSNDSLIMSKSSSDLNKTKQMYRSDSMVHTRPIIKKSYTSSAVPVLSSKENVNEKRMNEIKKACNKSFDANVKTLEHLIQEIKTKGFGKCKDEFDQKSKIKKTLEISVENLIKKVNFVNGQKKNYGGQNSKMECEINMYRNMYERCQREKFFMEKEIPALKMDILEINKLYGEAINETNLIHQIEQEEQREIDTLKEDIKKMNKRISEIEKDKESIRTGKKLLNRHVETLKDKIQNENNKSRDFIMNVSTLVDKSLLN